MNSNVGKPDNPFEWAKDEASKDLAYWKNKSQNGIGLIKQIADFVLLHGRAAQALEGTKL